MFQCFSGVIDEILNRLKFQTPVGATLLQAGGGTKPAMHFVNEDDKLQSELKVKKGLQAVLLFYFFHITQSRLLYFAFCASPSTFSVRFLFFNAN